MWLKNKLLGAGKVLLSLWAVALGLALGLGAVVAAVAIAITGAGAVLKYTPLSSVPGMNYVVGGLVLLLIYLIAVKSPISWRGNTDSENRRQTASSGTAHGSGSGGDAGYLEYRCEQCGTVLDDWNINDGGSSHTCGHCGHRLDNQRAAREKVAEGMAWDEQAEESADSTGVYDALHPLGGVDDGDDDDGFW